MRNNYKQNILHFAKSLLVVLISCFAFAASAQTFSITSVSTPDNGVSYYPYEEIDVTYASDYSWPTGTTFYLILDVDGDGEYSDEDHLLDSDVSTSGTLTGTLPNDPGTYDLIVVAGNAGSLGSDSELSDSQITVGSLTLSGTDEGAYSLSFDLLNTDRAITTTSADYDDGYSYSLFVSLDADSVTSSNPVMLEYIVNDDTVLMSDVEGDSEFTAINDTLVFSVPAGALTTGVRFRLSQQGGDTLAADTLEWIVSDFRLQANDAPFVRYGQVNNGGFTVTAPEITLGGDSISTYVGEDIGVAYESFGYTTGATFYLFTGDIEDPDDRFIYGSSTSLEDSITGTWGYSETDIDLQIAGYYGNIETPEYDLGADTLDIFGADDTDYTVVFDESGVRSATTPSLDISGEDYATLEISLQSNGSFSSTNALVVQYNVGSGWVTIDSLSGTINDNFEFEITSAMLSTATSFRVRQANTGNGSGVNEWYLYNFDVRLHDLESTSSIVANPGNYPLFYSIDVQDVLEVTVDDDTVSITEAYPGDEILVYATISGVDADADSLNYAVVIDGTYLLEDVVVNVDADTDSILISGTVPAAIIYDTNLDVQVKLYSGSTAVVGLNVDVFNDYDAEADDSEIAFMGGEYDSGTKSITFEDSGDRWVTTPGINIPSNDGLTLDFTIQRTSGARSPDGTEVVLEYSTDGGSNYTTLGTYSINAGGAGGTSYTLEDDILTTDVVGSSTMFRFRQLSNNGADLDGWTLSNVVFNNGTTILTYAYLNYNGDVLDVLEPVITLEEFDDTQEYYPGEDLEVTFSIEGVFPDNTGYELFMDNEVPLVFGEFTAAGTYTVTVPAVVADVYSNIKIRADYEDVESNSVILTVNAVEIIDITITSSESTTDGDFEFIYPGNEITVSYNTVGEIGADVLAYLEVFDGNEDDYVVLEDSLTVGDDITTTLPIGLDYTANGPEDGDPGPDFRLTLKDMSGNVVYTTDDVTWNNSTAISDERFPLDDRLGHVSVNYWYNNSSTRSATSIPYNFANGGAVDFDLRLLGTTYYEEDQPIYLQYSTDGETWVELEEGTIENTTADIFPDVIEIPEEAWMDSVYLRFIYNEDGLVSGTRNIIYFYGFDINYYMSEPIAEAEFDLDEVSDISLEYLSLSLATLEDTEFNLGEEFTVQYNADGPFGDVDFAVVMEETVSGDYKVLAESDQTGAVELTVSAPEIPFGDASPNYQVAVYPFEKVSDSDTYRAAAETESLTAEEDFVAVSGSDDTTPTFTFDEDGERYLTTRAVSLENYEFATLNFTSAINGSIATVATLPVLEASTDGETFEVIPVTGATYEDEGYVYPGMSYNVEIPEEYLVAEVWFRWRQPLNGGAGNHTWSVYNVSVSKGESNVFNPDAYNSYNMPQSVSLNDPDLSNYVWAKADSLDAVFNGEDFEFTWEIDSADIDETTFPDGTMFIFTLDGVTDPETGEELELASGTNYGTYSASIPYYVENDAYGVNLTAYVTYTNDDGEEEDYYFFEDDAIPSASLDIFLRVVRTTLDFDENDVLYAGSTATFTIEQENDESNASDLSDLYANLLAVDVDGSNDMILATQLGDADITVDLPPFLDGSQTFVVEFSEDAPLGSVGDIGEFQFDEASSDEDDLSLLPSNFLSGHVPVILTKVFDASDVDGTNAQLYYQIDNYSGSNVYFEYSMNGGPWILDETETGGGFDAGYSLSLDLTEGETVQFRWRFADATGVNLDLTYLRWYDGNSYLYDLEDNDNYMLSDISVDGTDLTFEDDYGRGLITTRDFSAEELEGKTLVSFDLTFNEIPENMVDNQYLIFEYSTDEGASYTELEAFPESDSEEVISDEIYRYSLDGISLTNGIRFRFRQEERNAIDVSINDFFFESGESLPFSYISDTRSIATQEVLITSVDVEEICQGDDIQLGYEILGRFGEDNILIPVYKPLGGASSELSGYEFSATEGTGTVTIQLPNTLLGEDDDNGFYRFALNAEDETDAYAGINEDIQVTGQFSESNVELVAPINSDATFSVSPSSIVECEPEDVIVTINDPQNYFKYVIYNVVADTVMDSLTYDPQLGEVEINLGSFDEDLELDMWITSMSSSGELVCNSKETTTASVEVTFDESFKLFVSDGSGYELVEAGDSLIVCAGASSGLTFDAFRDEDDSSNPDMIEWFRDDLDNFVSNSATISGTLEAGDYFARITDGSCTYLTESFRIVEVDVPDAPEVTVVSGDLISCDGEVDVVLTAPDGFVYYEWSNGETTQSITVDEEDDYSVRVGNTFTCMSDYSEAVEVEAYEAIEFLVYSDDLENTLSGGETITVCAEADFNTFDIEDDGSTQNAGSGVYVVYKDGIADQSFTGNFFSLDESGEYFVEWVSDILNPNACSSTSATFTVEILDAIEERPLITADGPLEFCEGDTVTLTANTEGTYSFYRWYNSTAGVYMGVNSQSIRVAESGTYYVQVSNVPFTNTGGCMSSASNTKTITVHTDQDPELDWDINTATQVSDLGDGEVIQLCSVNDNYLDVDGASGYYTWYLDGVEIGSIGSSSDRLRITQSGTYYAEVSQIFGGANVNSCVSVTNEVVVEFFDQPDAVSIADPGVTAFCEDEVDVTLTADPGAAFYQWRRNGGDIGQPITSNTLHVTQEGEYTVYAIAYDDGCYSEESNVITIEVIDLPYTSSLSYDYEATCDGGVVIELFNTQPEFSYQLVDEYTAEELGNPVTGASGSVFIDLPDASEEFDFDIEITYADGSSSCSYYYDASWNVEPNDVILELSGITLSVTISGDDFINGEIRWYRNGIEMVNKAGATSISVVDEATYTVEVDYFGGCVVTSNAIDLSSGRSASPLPEGQIVATTYPNPTVDVVNLDIPGDELGMINVRIVSISGQIVMSGSFNKDVNKFIQPIDISTLNAGIYTMIISQGNKVENISIVKQ